MRRLFGFSGRRRIYVLITVLSDLEFEQVYLLRSVIIGTFIVERFDSSFRIGYKVEVMILQNMV
jgi:hypothetical protein